MGTPVPLRAREEQCKGANPEVATRQLTPEERKYYDSLGKPKKRPGFIETMKDIKDMKNKEESEEMGIKLITPTKEILVEMLVGYESKYKAATGASKKLGVSIPTVSKWIKEYDIQFDEDGKVINDYFHQVSPEISEDEKEKPDQQNKDGEQGPDTKKIGEVIKQNLESGTSTDQISDTAASIVSKLRYSNYDVGSVLVEFDFQMELVKIGDSKEMTFKEAAAVVSLIEEIL